MHATTSRRRGMPETQRQEIAEQLAREVVTWEEMLEEYCPIFRDSVDIIDRFNRITGKEQEG